MSMDEIILFKTIQSLSEPRVLLSVGHCSLHEHTHTVSNELPHLVDSAQWHSARLERIVATTCQVVECIQQSAIEIENINFVIH